MWDGRWAMWDVGDWERGDWEMAAELGTITPNKESQNN